MAGSNAFAFNGTAFVPEDRDLTAAISVRPSPSSFSAVSRAYSLVEGDDAVQFWLGYPPVPGTPTLTNERTGTFPNLDNSITIDWECTTSSLIASFSLFVRIGTGSWTLHDDTILSTDRTYVYGSIDANTEYSFYIKAVGSNGLNTTSPSASITLTTAGPVSNLRETSTSSSAITWTWDVTAGVYQRFNVYRWNGSAYVYNSTVNATESGTSFTHTWSSLSENTTYSIAVYGVDLNDFQTTSVTDSALTLNNAPTAPSISAVAVDVASEPGGNTNTTPSVTRYFTVTVDPSNDDAFSSVSLFVSTDNSTWGSAIATWSDNTNAKTYSHAVTVTSESTGVTRYFRAVQYDTYGASTGANSGSVTSDTMGSTYVPSSYNQGAGSLSNEWVVGQNLGVTSWAVTSTFNDDTATYGGDQAFDGNNSKSWRSKSVTNARIRITFPISGNWVNGVSGVRFWPAAAYNTYISLSSDGGTTWLGSGSTPGTGQPYVEYIPSSSISPNVLNTIDIDPDRYVINGTAGSSSYSWAVRLEFTATTARTFEVNQIDVKQLTQNYETVDNSYYRYW